MGKEVCLTIGCSFFNPDKGDCGLGYKARCKQAFSRRDVLREGANLEFAQRVVRIPEVLKKHIKRDGR